MALYKTSDLYFAAYLRVAGVPFSGIERDADRAWFLFSTLSSVRDLKNEFYAGTAQLPAYLYAKSIRDMKALLHHP